MGTGVKTNMLNSLLFLASDLSIDLLSNGLETVWTLSCTVQVKTKTGLPLFHLSQGPGCVSQKPAEEQGVTCQPWLAACYLGAVWLATAPGWYSSGLSKKTLRLVAKKEGWKHIYLTSYSFFKAVHKTQMASHLCHHPVPQSCTHTIQVEPWPLRESSSLFFTRERKEG